VIREIESAAGVSTTVDISEREARDLKPVIGQVTDAIRERVADRHCVGGGYRPAGELVAMDGRGA
jgi:hypothetical protein